MYIRLSPYNIDVAASTVSLYMYSFAVQMLLKKPAGLSGIKCLIFSGKWLITNANVKLAVNAHLRVNEVVTATKRCNGYIYM